MKYLTLFFLLAACAPQMPVFKPVTVDIPVMQPCRLMPVAAPDFALGHIDGAHDDLIAKTKAALIELDQRKAYEAELISQRDSCP